MFTIKHVTTLGHEELVASNACGYYAFDEPKPITADTTAPPPHGGAWAPLTGKVWYEHPSAPLDSYRELLGGMVYVMNSDGATVSKWDLGGWAEPTNAPT